MHEVSFIMSSLIGLLAGIFGGLVGLGGGAVIIPMLVHKFKLIQRQAHGTSLVVVIFSGLAGTFTYAMKSSVDVGASLILAAAAITTARWGARYCSRMQEYKLKRSFGGFLILVALLLLLKPYITAHSAPVTGWLKVAIFLTAGFVTGFISGMMGVGGGALMVGAMVLFAGMSQHVAQGCSLLAMVPTAAVGSYTHWKLGNVVRSLLPGLIAGVLIGTYIGGSIALLLPETALRIIFAAVLSWMGLQYIRTPAPTCED
jgi:uncharacterized membrane protein YfcA